MRTLPKALPPTSTYMDYGEYIADMGIVAMYLLAGLATYRLAYLIANERGPFDAATAFRSWLLRRVDLDERHWLYDGMTCVRCLSWWLALPCVALMQWGGLVGALLIGWWGVSGGVLVLAQVLDAMTKVKGAS